MKYTKSQKIQREIMYVVTILSVWLLNLFFIEPNMTIKSMFFSIVSGIIIIIISREYFTTIDWTPKIIKK